MIVHLPFGVRLRPPRQRLTRCLLALVIVVAATVLRFCFDPLLHDQVPYFVYVAAVVVGTWFAGIEGGVTTVVAGAVAGSFFFVPPRRSLPSGAEDLFSMATFALLSLALMWLVNRWRRAERGMRDLQARTAAIIQHLPVGVAVADASGRLVFGNPGFERIARRRFVPASLRDACERATFQPRRPDGRLLSPDDVPLARAMRGETVTDEEVHIVWPDGTRTIVSASAAPLHDAEGRLAGAVVGMSDITQQITAAESAEQRAEELQVILDTVPAAVFTAQNADATRMTGNRFASEVLRLPRNANLSLTAQAGDAVGVRILRDGREIPTDELPVQQAALGGVEVIDAQFDLAYPDGTVRTLLGNASPLRDSAGRVRGSIGAFVDVTERNRMALELRRHTEELERHVEQLAASEARYRIMGETLPYGVWLSDARGRAIYASQSFLDLLGLTMEEMQQFGWTSRLMPEDIEPMMNRWLQCVATGDMWDGEHRIVDRQGKVRTVLTRGLPVRDANGAITCWVGVNLDITLRKAMERRLAEQAEELDRANRMKDEFLATLSHELRTPLNAIVGWADMLRRGYLSPDHAKRAVDSIYRNAKVQNQIIDDVLDVSRIISGKLRLDTQPVDLAAVLQSAVESVRAATDAKGIRLVSEVASAPCPVSGDATRLQQVFWNLLSNAVKFTDAGGHIRLSLRPRGDHVQVQVADSGIGISAEFLPHVFERFQQRDSSITRTYGGLGLGLAIVRHLVELHGGTVRAESAGEGRGSAFTVTLPAKVVSRPSRSVAADAPIGTADQEELVADMPDLSGLSVVVVDDEEDARHVAASILGHHGAVVSVASNATDGLAVFECVHPDVLLVDLAMPEMDGYSFLERLRATGGPWGAVVPAVALTAYVREEDRRRALASGFQQHLGKPIDARALVDAVARAHRQGRNGAPA